MVPILQALDGAERVLVEGVARDAGGGDDRGLDGGVAFRVLGGVVGAA
jgi:hypothetical protein